MATNADIIVKIVGKDEVTPVIKNIEGSVTNLSKMFQGFSTGNLTQSMSGLTGLSQTIQNIGNSMGGLGKGFEGLGGKITEAGGALKAFAGSSAGLAVTIGAGIAVAVGAVGIGLAKMSVDLMQFASSEEKAVAQTKHTLDQLGKSNEFENTMKNIAKHEASSRFESEELNKAYVQLLTTTKDTAKANDWLALSMDIASKKGLDLYQVSKTLSKVVAGEARAGTLSSLGIDIDEIELEKFKTNADKVKYLYTELMETFEGSAQIERDTGAGALENIGKQVDNIKEELGLALLEGLKPLMESIGSTLMNIVQSEGFKSFTESISTLASSFGELMGSSAELLANILGLEGADELVKKIGDAFGWVAEKIQGLSDFLTDLKNLISDISSMASDMYENVRNGTNLRSGNFYDRSISDLINDNNTKNQTASSLLGDWRNNVTTSLNDGFISKSGQIIKFNDNDNILAFQGNLQGSTDGVEVEDINKTLQEQEQVTAETNDEMNKFQVLLTHTSTKFNNLGGYITTLQEKINNFSVSSGSGKGYGVSRGGGSFDGSSCNSGTSGAVVDWGGGSYEVSDIQIGDSGGYEVPTWQDIAGSGWSSGVNLNLDPNIVGSDAWLQRQQNPSITDFSNQTNNTTGNYRLVDIMGSGTDETMRLREQFGIQTSEQTNQAYLNQMHPLQTKLVESYNALVKRVEKAGGKVKGIATGSLSYIDTITGTSFDTPEGLDAWQNERNQQYAEVGYGGKITNDKFINLQTPEPQKNYNIVFNIYESKDARELTKQIMTELNRVVRVG